MNKFLTGREVKRFITEYVGDTYNVLDDQKYEVETIDAHELISPHRFDFAAKWLYIDHKERKIDSQISKELYKQHLDAFSDGSFVEPGSEQKDSLLKYVDSFDELIDNISQFGFDDKKTLIPVTEDYIALDGAHRIAACIYFNKPIRVVKIPNASQSFGYTFFKARGIKPDLLDIMASTYSRMKNNIYVAVMWPRVNQKETRKSIDAVLRENTTVYYEKEIDLNYNGLHNLVVQLYSHHDWSGSFENKYKGAKVKTDNCFSPDSKVKIYIFSAEDLNSVTDLKSKIRKIAGVGNHAVHITDNLHESKQAVEILLNRNSIHYLNFANPSKFTRSRRAISQAVSAIQKEKHLVEDFAFDSGVTLSVYGLRETSDVDYLSRFTISNRTVNADNHSSQLKYYNLTLDDLIYNPLNYFYFEDTKFISLDVVKQMKKNRNEQKDRIDIELIDSTFTGSRLTKVKAEISTVATRYVGRLRRKTVSTIAAILKKLGLFAIVKKMLGKQ